MNAGLEFATQVRKIQGIYPVPNEQQAYVKWYTELSGSKDCLKGVNVIVTDVMVSWCDGDQWFDLLWSEGSEDWKLENDFINDVKEKGFFGRDILPTVIELDFENKYIKLT